MLEEQIKNEVTRLGNLADEDIVPEKTKRKISGLVENYKEPLSKRVIGALFEGDPKKVVTALINEVAIPKTKDILADLFIGGIEKAIYGDDTASTNRNYYSGYSSYSSKNQPTRRSSYEAYYKDGRYYTPESSQKPKVRWDRIVMATRQQAVELIRSLQDDIRKYKSVSVLELYDYVTDIDEELGAMIDAEFPDNNWGWVNLDRVPIETVSGGYWVKLPKPVRIN